MSFLRNFFFAQAVLLLLGAMGAAWAPPLAAQASLTRFPASVKVGQTSAAQAVLVTLQASGTMGTPAAVTQGVGNGEFAVAAGGTCAAGVAYTSGQSCTVQVVFAPLFPGRRYGAVVLKSTGGQLLGSALVLGSATGSLPRLSPGQMDTVAGDRSWIYASDGVSAVGAPVFLPQGLAVDAAGNLFLSDSGNSRIRRVDAVSGLISTVVGTGTPGYNGDELQGTSTSISQPAGLALDGAGNLYFADSGNGLIRRLDAVSGRVKVVAGTPSSQGFAGDGGLATSALLTLPEGIAFDDAGDLLIADSGNNAVRLVDALTGLIRTIAGTGTAGYSGDGGPATQGRLNSPWSLLVAPDGSVYIADFSNDRVRKVSPSGVLSTFAGTGMRGFSGDGGLPTQASLDAPTALAMDPAGDLYLADSGNNRVRVITISDGTIQTVAGNSGDSFSGDGGPANQASLYGPYALLFDSSANLFVADMFHNRVRRISGQSTTLTFATIRVSKTSVPQAQGLGNAGNDVLTLGTPGLTNTALDANTSTCLTAQVAPGDGCNLGVEFAPTVIGNPVQGGVTVNSNSGGITPVITVQGEVLSVEPTSTVLTVSANPALVGDMLTITATVSSDDPSRSGSVSILEGQTVVCTATLNSAGIATCSTSSLTLGQHTLSASYAGDANNASSVSAVVTEVIKQAPQLALQATPNPSVVTGAVTLKLSATASVGTPAGTVTFSDGAAVLGTAAVNSSGVASFSTTQLVPGSHTLTAQYSGDASNAPGTSNAISQTVNQASTVTTLSSSNAAATVANTVTFSALVSSPAGPTPTGSVSFNEGATVLGTAVLDSNGRASVTLSSLAPGTHNLTAVYSGDTNSAASSSTAFAENVAQVSTLTTLAGSANPLSAGAVLHLNASVAGAQGANGGTLSGTVTFSDGSTVLGTDTLDQGGHATLAVPGLSVATHTITATYTGSTDYAVSTSAALSEVVSSTPTSVSLVSSASSSLAGKSVTFNVVVSSSTGTPTGTVVLHDAAAVVGQVALSTNGTATFTLSSLAVGAHSLVATYSGDANYSPSASSAAGLSVALAQPTLSLNGPTSAINAGATAAFSASVASSGITPTGTLTFRDGSSLLATQAVGSGTAAFSTDGLALGSHAITVFYSGDDNNAPVVSGILTVVVQQAVSATTLSGASPITLGTSLTLTANVGSGGPHLTGTVTFQEGSSVLGAIPMGADGVARLNTSSLSAGQHAIVAIYGGDTNHLASTSTALNVLVVQPATAALSSIMNPAISGIPVTLIAKISATDANANGKVPAGLITFSDGANVLGTASLDATGAATLSSSTLAVGVHALQITYAGDSNFGSASATLTQSITSASTQIGLVASQSPATYGSPLSLTATISSNGGVATGSVTFLDDATSLGTAVLNANGVAQLTVTTLSPGTHTLAASYAGDGRASASASGPVSVVVKQATMLMLSSSANPTQTLSQVQFTATVRNAGAGSATGAVSFLDGSTALGTAPLDGSGQATITLPKLSAGSHAITASYAGDNNNFASNTAAPLTQTVQLRPTSTAVTSSSTNASDPQQITLIAVVHGEGSFPPGGTVTFQSGSTTVGTSPIDETGVATLTIELETKQEGITATYGGDASYNGSNSPAMTVTAGAATQFTLQVNPLAVSVASKQHTSVTLTLQSVKGFNDTLKLGCLGLPFAATCTFSSPESALAANGSSTVQLTLDTGDPLGAGAQAVLHESSGRGVWLCLLPAGLLLMFGRVRRSRVPQLLILMFAAALTITASGCSGLQVNGTPPGTYTLKVTASGTGTGATQSQTIVLTVTQ